jgi:hypothetical protein
LSNKTLPQDIVRLYILERKRKRGRKRKAPRVYSNKGEANILRDEKHLNFKNMF